MRSEGRLEQRRGDRLRVPLPCVAAKWPLMRTVAWGLFCTSSWTWCIGMYLPVILLGRFGWPGFLAFAIPNVLGCTAFGYVQAKADAAPRRVEKRLQAASALSGLVAGHCFSLATIAFHLFFVAFCWELLVPATLGGSVPAPAVATVAYIAALAMSRLPDAAWPIAGTLVFLVSVGVFAILGTAPLGRIGWSGDVDSGLLGWLAPTLAFGLLLCPYLDLTLHRARARSPSRHAFAVFGATFPVMLLLTCAYWNAPHAELPAAALVHIGAQTLFTVAAHLREVMPSASAPSSGRRSPRAAAARRAAILLAPVALAAFAFLPLAITDRYDVAEATYLRFLVFYGLIFPAFVLLFGGASRPASIPRKALAAYGLFVLAAAPFYELGFIQRHAWLLPIPLVGMICWKLLEHFVAEGARIGVDRSAGSREDGTRSRHTCAPGRPARIDADAPAANKLAPREGPPRV